MASAKSKSGSGLETGSPKEIDVYIKLSSGKVVPLKVNAATTIASVCAKIRGHESSVPSARLALKYQGEILAKSKTVGKYGVCKETVLRVEILESKPLNIFVKLEESSRVVPMKCESTNTVEELKNMINTAEGIAPRRQTLRVGSTVLSSPLSSLQECGVEDESVVKLEVSSEVVATAVLPAKDATAAELNDEDKQDVLGSFAAGFGADQVVDVVFSFDTTGSMYSCLAEVRRQVSATVERLLQDIPNIQIGIIAHGDYCDYSSKYVLKLIDLTKETEKIVDFVNNVPSTGGGDCPECYEWVLVKAQTLSWRPNSAKALVVIGDALPHPAGYTDQDISWRQELLTLKDMGVKVYGVQALNQTQSIPFYKELARVTGGKYLKFANFSLITDMFLAVCYGASCPQQLQAYQLEVEMEGRMTEELGKVFEELHKDTEETKEEEEEEEEVEEKKGGTKKKKDAEAPKKLDDDFSSPNAVRQSWWSRSCGSETCRYTYNKKEDEWGTVSHKRSVHTTSSTSTRSSSVSTPHRTPTTAAGKKTSRLSFRKRSRSTAATATRHTRRSDIAPSREEIRVGLLGSAGVGKRSLACLFAGDVCAASDKAASPATGTHRKDLAHAGKPYSVETVVSCQLVGSPLEKLMRSRECFLIMYSPHDKASFDDAREVGERVRSFYGFPVPAPIILVANKETTTHKEEGAISPRQGSELAKRLSCPFLEIGSAKQAASKRESEDVFVQMLKMALDARDKM
eukprot:scpid37354/ scgid5201/ Polyubiquitin; Ubiquitin; Ubiquitin-related